MRLGREATAARRQASRLAGLVQLPAAWRVQTAIRRQASWLAIKASMASKPRWPFAFQIVQTMNAGEQPPHSLTLQNRQATGVIPTRKGSACPPPTAGEQRPSFLDAAKPPSYVSHPNPQGVSLPHADCGGAEALFLDAAKPPSHGSHPNPQGVSMPTANCGGAEAPIP